MYLCVSGGARGEGNGKEAEVELCVLVRALAGCICVVRSNLLVSRVLMLCREHHNYRHNERHKHEYTH